MNYCPNCKTELNESKHLAQHVRECSNCKGRYFIIETTRPKHSNVIIGIKDKNGDELYDGCSVTFYYKGEWVICKVIYNKGMYCLKWQDGYVNRFPLHSDKYELVK